MKKCDWCNTTTKRTMPLEDLGNKYVLCNRCYTLYKAKMCRVCGGPLGRHSIQGVCLACKQVNTAANSKIENEISNGVELNQLRELTESVSFTEEDYNNWVVFGQGNFKKIEKDPKDKDKKFIIQRFSKDNIWNMDNIDKYIDDILSLLDRHTDKLNNPKLHIIKFEDMMKFMGAQLIDKENEVILIVTQ